VKTCKLDSDLKQCIEVFFNFTHAAHTHTRGQMPEHDEGGSTEWVKERKDQGFSNN